MSKPVIVRLQNGATYGLPSAAKARELYGEGVEIVSYADGTPFEGKGEAKAGKPVSKMNRGELETYAAGIGIQDAHEFGTVDELRAAVKEAEAK